MIDGLKPYAEYKPSGLPWVDTLPAHWRVNRGKSILRPLDQRSRTGEEELLTVSSARGVVPRRTASVTMFKASSYKGHKLCWPGDLAINSLWAWAGGLGVSKFHGIVSTAYGIYRPRTKDMIPGYLHELVRSSPFNWELQVRSKGIWTSRLQLTDDSFLCAPFIIPPPDEQAAIVRFLNHANGRIERLILSQRRLIALLNEQKQAIIHQAVARGSLESTSLSTSGSHWFPDLPSGWKVVSLRRVLRSAIDGPHFSPAYQETGIPFLSARNIRTDRWKLDDVKYISKRDFQQFSRRVAPEPDDVLYTKGGTTGVARAVDLDFPFQVWVHVAVLKLRKHLVLPKFLAYCLNSPRCYSQSQLFTRGATNQDLGLGRMMMIELPLPSRLEEQQGIIDKIETSLRPSSIAIARAEREIELLQEYRIRLTADVVTGRLDVREAAENLPELEPKEAMGAVAAEDNPDLDAEQVLEEV